MRVMHVIGGLGVGGAEMMLLKLLTAGRDSNWEALVVSLSTRGPMGARIAELGIPVYGLGLRRNLRGVTVVPAALVALAWRFRPNLVQGWMYEGNLAASLAGVSHPRRSPVLWNMRQTIHDIAATERPTIVAAIRLGARLSRHPAAIIYNSERSAEQHEAFGYRADHRVLIPNGFDTDMFRPSPEARSRIREGLGIAQDAILVGLVARYHPMKDHRAFLLAAASLVRNYPTLYFVLAGTGVSEEAPELSEIMAEHQLSGRVFLLGERADVPEVTAALDIACSASWGEGFSNAIGEAMACGVPCVVTDVGDSARIVADTGVIVVPRDPQALASGIARLIEAGASGRSSLGLAARRRVEAEYSLPAITRRYHELYDAHAIR